MNLLLDTHTLLWWLAGAPIDPVASARIADPTNVVAVSAVSVWEIGIKRALGKLEAPDALVTHISDAGFEGLSVSLEHAERASALPPHHRDPFDRMLVAQAQLERLAVVTRDRRFASYDVKTVAC